jgi:hypothetical protein
MAVDGLGSDVIRAAPGPIELRMEEAPIETAAGGLVILQVARLGRRQGPNHSMASAESDAHEQLGDI